jgi:hypothetical protein
MSKGYCNGKTQKGEQCKKRVTSSEFCHLHRKQVCDSKPECKADIVKYNDECPICLESDGKMIVLECGHGYHLDCTKGLTSYDCPMCRAAANWPAAIKKQIRKNIRAKEQERIRDERDMLHSIVSIDISDTELDSFLRFIGEHSAFIIM